MSYFFLKEKVTKKNFICAYHSKGRNCCPDT